MGDLRACFAKGGETHNMGFPGDSPSEVTGERSLGARIVDGVLEIRKDPETWDQNT